MAFLPGIGSYLIQLVLGSLRVVDAGLVAVMTEMTGGNEAIAPWMLECQREEEQ
jgi:hypothetical protein